MNRAARRSSRPTRRHSVREERTTTRHLEKFLEIESGFSQTDEIFISWIYLIFSRHVGEIVLQTFILSSVEIQLTSILIGFFQIAGLIRSLQCILSRERWIHRCFRSLLTRFISNFSSGDHRLIPLCSQIICLVFTYKSGNPCIPILRISLSFRNSYLFGGNIQLLS